MNSSRMSPDVPVNRTLVGVLAVVCLACAGGLSFTGSEGPSALWQGAFFRVGVVMAAFWLALPSRNREAAWARVPLWNVVVGLAVLVAVVRLPNKLALPALLAGAAVLAVLRQRKKSRPARRVF